MKPRTMAVPMSGWARIRTQAKPVTRISGPDDAAVGGVLIEAAGDEVRGEEREGQLHQLGRLQAELPEADPSARPHGVHAEAGHQHDEEEPERHEEEQRAEPPQLAVVDAHGQPQRHDADRHPHGLPDQDRPRRAVGRDGDHRGGGPDHHEPDDAEQRDVDEQDGRERQLAPADVHPVVGSLVRRRAGAVRPRPSRVRRLAPARRGRGRRRAARRRHAVAPWAWTRPSARSDTRCTAPVSRTGRPKWRSGPGHVNFATVRKSP